MNLEELYQHVHEEERLQKSPAAHIEFLTTTQYLTQYLHGECVAMGMLYFMSEDVQKRVLPIYKRMHLQSDVPYDSDEVFEILCKDKKASGDHVTVVKVNTIGKAELKEWKLSDVRHILKG